MKNSRKFLLFFKTILFRAIKCMNHLLLHSKTKFANLLTSAHFTSQVGRLESSSDKWSNKVRNKFEPKCQRSQAKVTQRFIASTHYVKDVAFSLTMTPFWAPSSFRTRKMCVTGGKAFFFFFALFHFFYCLLSRLASINTSCV